LQSKKPDGLSSGFFVLSGKAITLGFRGKKPANPNEPNFKNAEKREKI